MLKTPHQIGLFATCLVDLFRPEVGFASVRLLEQSGCKVSVPTQSCCGQIAFNNGLFEKAKALAWQIVEDFEGYDYVVLPSGSCGGMIKVHYPELFRDDDRLPRVQAFCEKVFELTVFLHDMLGWQPDQLNCDLNGKQLTYHDSCTGLRKLGIKHQPRNLLKSCANIEVSEMVETDTCCGFGGTFCIKFPDIANRMAENKLTNAQAMTPDYLVGGDVSCLLHLAGKWQRQQSDKRQPDTLEIRHVAEVLAGELNSPPINAIKAPDAKRNSE